MRNSLPSTLPVTLIVSTIAAHVAAPVHAQTKNVDTVPELAQVIVTSSPLGGTESDQITAATVLRGPALEAKRQNTLGETLANEPGVSATGFGPNASRPVIRGLDGDRIRVLSNGNGVFDASATSVDHAVGLNPLFADRIEILRGSAALRFGGTAIGGVVNVLDSRIPDEAPNGLSGQAIGSVRGRSREDTIGAQLNAATSRLAITADGFRISTGDVKIPGLARSAAERNSATPRYELAPGSDEPSRRLMNSGGVSEGGSLGVAARGNWGSLGISQQSLNSNYGLGLFAEPDTRIGLEQQRTELKSRLNMSGFFESLRLNAMTSRYRHTEYDVATPDTTFRNNGSEARLEAAHRRWNNLQGLIGVQVSGFRFSAVDADNSNSFLPNTKTNATAIYLTEGLKTAFAEFNAGLRHEKNSISSDDSVQTLGCSGASKRDYSLNSGTLGTRVPLSFAPGHALTAQVAHSERAPTYQELYACGEHAATLAKEYGSGRINKERSNSVELGWQFLSKTDTVKLNAYRQQFSSFITATIDPGSLGNGSLDATGRGNRGADGNGNFFPDYLYGNSRARLTGFEAQWRHTFAAGSFGLGNAYRPGVELRADKVVADNLDTGMPLPRISPMRLGISGLLTYPNGNARLDINHNARQSRVAPDELPTDAYTFVNAYASYRLLATAAANVELFGRVHNLLNQEGRNAVSFLKDVVPLPGRTVTVGLKALF
jgi:iron complex outermembrane receptor protein